MGGLLQSQIPIRIPHLVNTNILSLQIISTECSNCSRDQAKEAIVWSAMVNKKPIKMIACDNERLKFVCEPPCFWKIWVSPPHKDSSDWMIKTLGKHENCPQHRTNMISSKFLAIAFEDLIRAWPDIKAATLQVFAFK